MIDVALDRPWLTATLPRSMRMLGWAPHRPGFVTARRVLWREVRDADLTLDFDARHWLAGQMRARGAEDDIGLLTSRNLARYSLGTASSGRTAAQCLSTVGLSNAERVGHRLAATAEAYGTINILVATDAPLSDAAMIEALSVATQARTAAVITDGPQLETGRATGTGTDCVVLACPPGDAPYAGLHTEVGEAIGRAVYDAVAGGVLEWMETGGAE